MARLIGPDKRVVVNQCTQWKRYSTPGTATRGENDPAGRVQVGELADRHDEAPDGQVAVELPARYSNKYAAWRRVIILLNNSPATLYNAATGLTWRHSAAEYTGFSTLTTVWKA